VAENGTALFENGHALESAMGYWPSFHDAEVSDVVHEGDSCRALLHVFEITNDVGPDGFLVLTKHHLVTMQMSGIAECTLPAIYVSDTLFGLEAERIGSLVRIVFDSAIDPDFCWHVLCAEARVVSVEPCGPRGERL
jgi:hypothetical protein